MDTVPDTKSLKQKDLLFTVAIPSFVFGGILPAIVLQQPGVNEKAGTFVWGGVAASILQGYFACLKPGKNVIAFCPPFYGIVMTLFPVTPRTCCPRPCLLPASPSCWCD